MTTARVVATDSLRELRIVAAEEEPTAFQLSDSLRRMNYMLHEMKSHNADLDYQDITLDEDVPLPPEHIDHLVFMLAARLASQFGTTLTPEVAIRAKESEVTLRAAYRRVGRLLPDEALRNRVQSSKYSYYSGS